MTPLKWIAVAIPLLIILYLASLSFITRHDRLKAPEARFLSPCPDTPNCVSSLHKDRQHGIAAFDLQAKDKAASWKKLMSSIRQSGGEILIDDGKYCHAVFTSTLFRFKDDVEALLTEEKIEIRSASRAGKSDLGQNRKRVEQIRDLYNH